MTPIEPPEPESSVTKGPTPVGSLAGDATTADSSGPTSSYTTIIDIEAQLLRNGQPLTRPTRWSNGRDSFEAGKLVSVKLYPGAANGGETVVLDLFNLGQITARWFGVQARISIDSIPFETRPGQLFIDYGDMWPYGGWSCIINYPILSDREHFKGVHTLLLRTIVMVMPA